MRPSTIRRCLPTRCERVGIFIRFLASLTLTALLASPIHVLAAQDAAPVGRVTGRVVDAASGAGLSDVTLRVVGANVGTMSGVNGQFTLTNVPAGTVSITARRLGFAAKTVTGIQLAAGRTAEQNISLTASTVQLEARDRQRHDGARLGERRRSTRSAARPAS